MKKIFLIGGGTGGHLFPAASIAQELENRGFATVLITDNRCVKYLTDEAAKNAVILNISSPAKRGLFAKLLALYSMLIAFLRMLKLFRSQRPSMLIAFGGYPTVPALMAAKITGTAIVLHEQNCFLGKVNRQFSKYARLLALNFKDTTNLDSQAKCAIAVVGNPVREEILAANLLNNSDHASFNILVIGGSQGAIFFDELVPKAIELLAKEVNLPIKIAQQANKANHQKLAKHYRSIAVEWEIAEFFYDMPQKYQAATVVICRSGASTIAELIQLGLPAIFVPLPTAANDHQTYNAKSLESKGASIYFPQKEASAQVLAEKLIELAREPEKLAKMSKNLVGMRTDATKNFADRIISIMINEGL